MFSITPASYTFLTLESSTGKLTLVSDDPADVTLSPITITLTATLVNYPGITPGQSTFTIEITQETTDETLLDDAVATVETNSTNWTVPSIDEGLKPKFNEEEAAGKYKLIGDEEPAVSNVKSLVVECKNTTWYEDLPHIDGEAEGKKFHVKVELEQASQIVTFNPATRRFELKKSLSSSQAGLYQVLITISDDQNLSSHYEMTVTLMCELDPVVLVPQSLIFKTQQVDPPVPRIQSIDQTGLVTIKFNSTMVPEVARNDDQLASSSPSRILDASTSSTATVGLRVAESGNFTSINNGTVYFEDNEWPSLEVRIWPDDPESESQCADRLGFTWECVDYLPETMLIQLSFEEPGCVSAYSNLGDRVEVVFYD